MLVNTAMVTAEVEMMTFGRQFVEESNACMVRNGTPSGSCLCPCCGEKIFCPENACWCCCPKCCGRVWNACGCHCPFRCPDCKRAFHFAGPGHHRKCPHCGSPECYPACWHEY